MQTKMFQPTAKLRWESKSEQQATVILITDDSNCVTETIRDVHALIRRLLLRNNWLPLSWRSGVGNYQQKVRLDEFYVKI